jgi:hypothetical protein
LDALAAPVLAGAPLDHAKTVCRPGEVEFPLDFEEITQFGYEVGKDIAKEGVVSCHRARIAIRAAVPGG